MLRKPKPNLRSRRPNRNAVPANPSFTNSTTTTVVIVTVAEILAGGNDAIVTRNRVGGSARHVPGERNREQNSDRRDRDDDDEPRAEALAGDQTVDLDRYDHRHVDRREVTENRVG